MTTIMEYLIENNLVRGGGAPGSGSPPGPDPEILDRRMKIVEENPGITVERLAELDGVARSTSKKSLGNMVEMGLVEKVPSVSLGRGGRTPARYYAK